MGSNGSKQSREKKTSVNNNCQKPVVSYANHNSDFEHDPESDLSKRFPRQKQRHNKLQNPSNKRPIELSWLQQNNSNDIYNRIDHHHHHHNHHSIYHREDVQRVPLAINRWPKRDDRIENQRPKSYIEEYVHQ